MSGEHQSRLQSLRRRLAEADLPALLVSSPSNIFYLSGFTGSAGLLLIREDRAQLFSDFRYRLQAQEQAPDYQFMEVERSPIRGVGEEVAEGGPPRVGFDPAHLTCALRDELADKAPAVELAPAPGLVEALRLVKTPDELARMRRAAALADQALAHMVSLMQPGAVERDIALEGEFAMRRGGAEEAAFKVIVASGPHSALPHAETTDRALQPGDLVVVDMGARVDGYCSDMTRTFAVLHADDEARRIYDLVYRAQRAALAQVRAGAVCGDLDHIARSLIEAEGHGDDFGHGLGHGVGVDVHEEPRLRRGVETALRAGNVVTVEPGIYLAGRGGVRLEDMVAVGEGGAEVLTRYPMEPGLPVL
jgi:Xaa-Pro aminopeptidase